MSVDLHRALHTLAETPAGPVPTQRLLNRVHRRRTSRVVATSAVGVGTAGALAVTSLGWWPDMSHLRAAAPAASYSATPATEVPPVAGSTAVWDLYPAASLDVAVAPTRTVTEALAAVLVSSPTVEGDVRDEVFVMDAADGAWVRPAWPTTDSGTMGTFALSPDGRTLATWVLRADDRRPGIDLVDVASGARTPVTGLERAGDPCLPAAADFAPDASLAVLTTCDAEAGPVVVFRLDPADDGAGAAASPVVTVEGTNLAQGGALEYSPDGSLLAIGSYDTEGAGRPRTTVVDADGAVVQQWPAALRSETVWYGNDALRASELEQTDAGEWKGWLVPSTGATVGEIRSYDEYPWRYGPPPALLGETHGQELRPHVAPADGAAGPAETTAAVPWAFDIEDTASGMVRAWLPVLSSTAPAEHQPVVVWNGATLAHRTR